MNNLMAALAERMAAVWIERIAGSKITTIAGVLGIAGTAVAQCTTYVPPAWRTYVTLAGVILAGTAAILARDASTAPVTLTKSASITAAVPPAAKLGAVMLCVLTLAASMPLAACNGSQVAQDIVNWTPALESAVSTVGTAAAVFDPSAGAIFAAATAGFDAASNVVVAEAKAYLANPTATVLAQLQTAVVTFQQQVNAALLDAAKITNAASQQHATALISAVATIINTILALVQSISSKTTTAQMASQATIKLAEVEPYLRPAAAARILALHYGEPEARGRQQLVAGLMQLQQAGF